MMRRNGGWVRCRSTGVVAGGIAVLLALATACGTSTPGSSLGSGPTSVPATTPTPTPTAPAVTTRPTAVGGSVTTAAGTPAIGPTAGAPAPPSTLILISEPNQGVSPIDAFLSSPRRTLDLTMYELVDTTAEEILAADAARGVTVRVVLDQNRERSANTPAYDYLAAHSVHVVWAPASYEATHEKAAVVDAGESDARSLVMTLNLTARYYATTRDFAVIDSDPADIAAIERVFDGDYAGQSSAATPVGTDLVWSPGSQAALVSLIDSARTSLTVENEEMSASAIIDALAAAAARGLVVKVIMTADSEWDKAFARLGAAGVQVHVYPDTSTALYIHAKAIVADGTTAFVGSENFSAASLDDNRELGIITNRPSIVSALATALAADYAGAAPWTS